MSQTCRNLATLTSREREILDQLRHGKLNKVIAGDLGLSVRTVEGHRAKIMEKMGARTLGQLIEMVVKTEPGGEEKRGTLDSSIHDPSMGAAPP